MNLILLKRAGIAGLMIERSWVQSLQEQQENFLLQGQLSVLTLILVSVHAYLAVTCHLHFWQDDQDLLHATAENSII